MIQALQCGLSLQDFEILTTGMILDYINTYVDMKYGETNGGEQKAGQEEFDRF